MCFKLAPKIDKLLTIKKCFRHFSLKNATLIIGYIVMMIHFADFVAESLSLSSSKDMVFARYNKRPDNDYGYDYRYVVDNFNTYDARLYSFLIVYQAFGFMFALALIWGTYKNNYKFIHPWLIFNGVTGSIGIIVGLILFILGIIFGEFPLFFVILTLLYCIITALAIHSYACVYSHYKELKAQETEFKIPETELKNQCDLPSYEHVTTEMKKESTVVV